MTMMNKNETPVTDEDRERWAREAETILDTEFIHMVYYQLYEGAKMRLLNAKPEEHLERMSEANKMKAMDNFMEVLVQQTNWRPTEKPAAVI